MPRKGAITCLTCVSALLFAAPASAAIDDLQIDWVVPAGGFVRSAEDAAKGFPSYEAKALPRRLYTADADVLAKDGSKLLPKGAQLYAMIGKLFMVCSQEQAAAPYRAASSRVCLVDEDGDRQFDTYFTRSMGRSWMSGDQMWFAMNNNVPASRSAIIPARATEIDRSQAAQTVSVGLNFYVDADGTIRGGASIAHQFGFSGRCGQAKPVPDPAGWVTARCLVRDMVVRASNFAALEAKDRKVEVSLPKRELALRFDVAPRLLGARLMNGVYLD